MRGRIIGSLRPVRRRQLGQLLLRSAAWGLLAGSIGGVYLGALRISGRPVSPGLALAFLIGAPAFALIVAALRGRTDRSAARAIDAHYRLKDRAVTALDFLAQGEPTPLHRLQVEDAERHLAVVQPREVAPIRLPRTMAYAGPLLALALGLLLWPIASGPSAQAAPAEPRPELVAESERIVERLKDLEKIAKSERNPELEKLVKELMEKAEEMKQPGVDVKEALAKLSEMQSAIAAQQAQTNVGLVDAQLQALGAALQSAESTDPAGQVLQEGKLDQAAQELEKLEAPPIDKKEARTLEEKLKQVAKQMGEAGLGQLSGAAGEMAEGIKESGNGQFRRATRTVANLSRSHAGRKRIQQLLDRELQALSECKAGECRSAIAVAAKGKKPEKTDTPSQNYGLSTSGNGAGDKTKLQAQRKVEEITGTAGEGPSETETTHSPEGRQQAARAYKDSYQKYKKMSEEVLDAEPIPLGHRQAIRKYFELIRPQVQGSEPAPAASK